ncbi:uncharacterized protein Ecym_2222 [Eremothecium cymbalariae DBVPG|uniref:FHA domain-containing protein n=1 Tax=Eremothecium cymbalariae (strain CBS 270.75 / DBVPG 7215 / KCTC 17166 / NRRL Y-17582) TaxID=931890 RepID=G8JP66_ERECY|nr:Hypothetical protein Ecym_2222 [Eremothecium cymbalariae DBVPG\
MNFSKINETRRIQFNIDLGLGQVIGRASDKDSERIAKKWNLFFHEKSLSKHHAMLYVKRFRSELAEGEDKGDNLYDNIRIYVEDLGSTHGIVDLQSYGQGVSKVIDLKNGERFGMVYMQKPITCLQSRGARLKFQVNVSPLHGSIWELVLKDVTYDDSPCVTKGNAVEVAEKSPTPYPVESCSDWNCSEDWYDDDMCDMVDNSESTEYAPYCDGSSLSKSNYVDLLLDEGDNSDDEHERNGEELGHEHEHEHEHEVGEAKDGNKSDTCDSTGRGLDQTVQIMNEYLDYGDIRSVERDGSETVDLLLGNHENPEAYIRSDVTPVLQNGSTKLWSRRSIFFGSVLGFVVGFIVGAANLE